MPRQLSRTQRAWSRVTRNTLSGRIIPRAITHRFRTGSLMCRSQGGTRRSTLSHNFLGTTLVDTPYKKIVHLLILDSELAGSFEGHKDVSRASVKLIPRKKKKFELLNTFSCGNCTKFLLLKSQCFWNMQHSFLQSSETHFISHTANFFPTASTEHFSIILRFSNMISSISGVISLFAHLQILYDHFWIQRIILLLDY